MQAVHGSNVPDTTSSGGYNPAAAPHRHRRSSSHSNSFSSASIVTLKRSDTQSPNDTSLIALRIGRESVSHEHQRRRSVAADSAERLAGDGLGGMNRMSHSTTSSVASIGNPNTRRSRASSGAALPAPTNANFSSPKRNWPPIDHSPRPSPHKRKTSSRPSSRRGQSPTSSPDRERRRPARSEVTNSLTALPPLQPTPALTDPNDTESPSTIPTVGTPHSSYGQDYFGDDSISPRTSGKSKKSSMIRSHMPSMSSGGSARAITSDIAQERISEESRGEVAASETVVSNEYRTAEEPSGSSSQAPGGGEKRHRRVRTHEKGEKDKKQMLSRALQKANTAVLLDNAQNFEGALEAYSDACRLLQQVMDRSHGAEDRRKLDSIRITYTNRMEELRQLQPAQPEMFEEKSLPARPMSDESLPLSPVSAVSPTIASQLEDPENLESSSTQAEEQSKFSPPKNDHDSFLPDSVQTAHHSPKRELDVLQGSSHNQPTIEEEIVSHGHFDFGEAVTNSVLDRPTDSQPLIESKEAVGLPPLRTDGIHLPLPDSDYVPAPLSPRRPPSPKLTPQAEQAWQEEPSKLQDTFLESSVTKDIENEGPHNTWLNTIAESTSSRASSVHSMSSEQGLHRKYLRGTSHYNNPELDAAFDAAVEAAYDQGLEPDLESRQKRESDVRGHTHTGSIAVRSSEIKEISPPIDQYQSNRSFPLALEDEEEEAILDYITQDYASGFNFDLSTKSALPPRQSDSSGYSRSTWQSSQVSDRTTAGTSLSTVAEDVQPLPASKNAFAASTSLNTILAEQPLPLAPPPQTALPKLPIVNQRASPGVRSRRLSGQNPKQLKIQTSTEPEQRRRASTIHHSGSPGHEDDTQKESALDKDFKFGQSLDPNAFDKRDPLLRSPPSLDLRSAVSDTSRPMTATTVTTDQRTSLDDEPTELIIHRPPMKKNKSSASLREHMILLASPTMENQPSIMTPMSTTFMSFAAKQRTNETTLTTQRANLPSFGPMATDSLYTGGVYLFDTSLSNIRSPSSPRSPGLNQPNGLEPCPESFLLRPFWLMRTIASTLTHPKGGYLTTRLFVPREVWLTRGVKLKSVEDKVANCDLLTAALGRLAGVDTYDADAVMEELQNFEEVMERVQSSLVKRLGSDVGISGLAGIFKDAGIGSLGTATGAQGAETTTGAEKTRSKEGKGYLNSWRKLRNKSSGAPIASSQTNKAANKVAEKELPTMDSVPMTNYVPVERRGQKKDVRNLVFDGPNRDYMGSLARLFEGAQILDQIARQVVDPGLKGTSQTHVGLELSIRHAAEFFCFYICRFVLADLGTLLDKFVKRGTEWVLA